MRRSSRLPLVACLSLVTACAFGGPGSPGDSGDPDDDPIGPGTQPPPSTNNCNESLSLRLEPVVLPPDLVFVLDRSSSMGEPIQAGSFVRKWDIVIDALIDVSEAYMNRVYFGLMLCPSVGDTCGAGVMDIQPGPYSGKNLGETLEDTFPGGGTPVAETIDNARAHFQSNPANPYGRYLLLATDGVPNCGQYADDDAIAAINRLRQDGIETYVLGYAFEGDESVLNDMAQAGGTGSYYPANSSFDLVESLEQITDEVSVVTCEYILDGGPDAATDLVVTMNGQLVPYSPDHTNGWDFDPVSLKLTFYGESCDNLRSASIDANVSADYCQDVD